MRKHRRNNQNHMFILGIFTCLLCMMGVGYAAFSTNLNITVKGNIKEMTAAQYLKTKIVNSGDGLYKDTYENDRYIYRGTNPDNYIYLDSSLYRIISVENDETLKIMKNVSVGNMQFDSDNGRYKANTYCGTTLTNSYGCNVWGSKTTMLDVNGNNITKMPRSIGGTEYELPEQEAYINTYLNGNSFYGKLSENLRNNIQTHLFNVGLVDYRTESTKNLATNISQEKQYKWRGNIGLANITDYIRASLNPNCSSVHTDLNTSLVCTQNNWLTNSMSQWSMSPDAHSEAHSGWAIRLEDNIGIGLSRINITRQIRPTFYLKPSIKLNGSGAENNPYTIKE